MIKAREDERERAPLERSLEKLLTPFDIFLKSQSNTGAALILATVAALWLANSEYSAFYHSINTMPFSIALGDWQASYSLQHWVNDGLIVLFFFVLGLEVKRECLAGNLRDIRHSSLVIFMALGGMLVPALVYLAFAVGAEAGALRGWGIPMATDTAFALGILALLHRRVPPTAAVVLAALAIVDDIGAVLVISLFYTEQLNLNAIGCAAGVLALLLLCNVAGVRKPVCYLLGGVALWWFVLHSGVHATTAGILTALVVPTRPYAGTSWFIRRMRQLVNRFEALDRPEHSILEEKRQHELAEQAQEIALKTTTPLQHWGSVLNRPVSLSIVPLFAFLNAGVVMPSDLGAAFAAPVTLGTAVGLVLGKSLGINLFAFICLRLGLAERPEGLTFRHIMGLSMLAGIGFTMSLFITALAFANHPQLLTQAKLGIMTGSLIAGALGVILLALPGQSTSGTVK